MNTVYILRAFGHNDGQFFYGAYSSLEKALVAKASLSKNEYKIYKIDYVIVDSEPEILY